MMNISFNKPLVNRMALDNYKHLTINICYFIGFCLILCPIAIYFGTSAVTLFYYLLYVILFNIVPGTLLYCSLIKEWKLTDGLPVIGWTVGLSLEVTLYNIFDQLGLIQYFYLFPIITILICSVVLLRSNYQSVASPNMRNLFFPPFIIITALSLVFIAIQWFSPNIDAHFTDQARVANSVLLGWPYQYTESLPLFYHYLIHTHLAAASHYTGIATLELATRSAPSFLFILCLSAIYYFSINIYKNKWMGILVIAQLFGIIGYQFIQSNFWGSAMPSAAILVFSMLAAFPVFLVLVYVTFNEVGLFGRVKEKRYDYGRFVLILLLLWSASGMRFPALTAYGAGLFLCIVWNYYRHKIISWNLITLIIALTIVSGLSLIRFYGLLSPVAATKFLEFVAGPAVSFDKLNFESFKLIQKIGLPYYITGVLAFLLLIAGKATFLSGGILWSLIKKQILRYWVDVFWLGTFLGSTFIWYFTYTPGGGHFTFLHYAHFALAFIGARGLCKYLSRPELSYAGIAVIIVTVSMALLHFGETGYYLVKKVPLQFQYQQEKPSLFAGKDYRLLIDYAKASNSKGSYLVVGDMDAAISPCLSAEIVGKQLGNSRFENDRTPANVTGRNEAPELINRRGFLNALSKETQKDILCSEEFLSIKRQYKILPPVGIIIAESKGFENKTFSGNGWMFKAGRFAVLKLL